MDSQNLYCYSSKSLSKMFSEAVSAMNYSKEILPLSTCLFEANFPFVMSSAIP